MPGARNYQAASSEPSWRKVGKALFRRYQRYQERREERERCKIKYLSYLLVVPLLVPFLVPLVPPVVPPGTACVPLSFYGITT